MKYKVNVGILMCLLWFIQSNCVEQFSTNLPDGSLEQLVVEGNIISDSTVVFCLSRTFSLNVESFPQDYNQIDAEVSVVGSDNSCFKGVSLGNGKYQVVVGTLNKDVSYNLKIVYNGDTYTSEPQRPLETEEIENVSYEQIGKFGNIYIYLSTRSKGAAYYIWSYEEVWEVRAEYKVLSFYDPVTDTIIRYDKPPCARGWCYNESTLILTGSTESTIDNSINSKLLYSITATKDTRVSCYYSTLMKQRKISKGEYEYYLEKMKLNESMGGLFTPQPSELPTNITCSNLKNQIIGYVGVNMNVTKYRIFIPRDDIEYQYFRDCISFIGNNLHDLYFMDFRIVEWFEEEDKGLWAPRECTDVRYLGASLEKPAFWPDETN